MTKKTHQSFTIRVPTEVYLEAGQLAQDEGVNLNRKINQLIMLGLGKHISLNDALRSLLIRTMTDEGKPVD